MGSQFKENSEHDSDHGWSNDVLMFSPLSRSWRPVNTKGSQPPPRAHHTLTTWIEQKVILFGGRSQGSRLNDLYILNMATEVLLTQSYWLALSKHVSLKECTD
jgi:hypothetical protein